MLQQHGPARQSQEAHAFMPVRSTTRLAKVKIGDAGRPAPLHDTGRWELSLIHAIQL